MLTLAGKALPVPILQGGMGVGVSLGGLAGAVAVHFHRRCGLPGAGFCPRPGKRQPPRPDR